MSGNDARLGEYVMAKATKVTTVKPVSQLALDTQTIAKDFARTATHNIDTVAQAALLRQVSNVDAFNSIKIEAQGAWAIARAAHLVATNTKGKDWEPRELSLKDARDIFNGSTRGATSVIGSKPKRDAFTQSLYAFGGVEWSRYLAANEIVTLNEEKANNTGARTPKADDVAPKADVNIVTPEAIVVTRQTSFALVMSDAHKAEAILAKVVNANSKIIVGDAGQRLRTLNEYVARELKAIDAMVAKG
jgi:hypothetical protein